MTESPDISQKLKRKQKKNKLKAFKDFLQVSKSQLTPTSAERASTVISDNEQKVDQTQQNFCSICEVDLGDKKRKCGFCNWPACSDHMRKKRKNKQANKFVRICDNCQDKYLYSKYMKLQVKYEQSIVTQQSIIQIARSDMEQKAIVKRKAMNVLKQKQNQILSRRKQQQTKWSQFQKQCVKNQQKLTKSNKQLQDLQQQIKKIQQKMPPPLQQDYRALQLRIEKVNKQIIKYEKLCNEASNVKKKKQKQLYDQYHRWQQTQQIKLNKKQQDCSIF